MGDDPPVPPSLEQKVDELLRRLNTLEQMLALQTRRIFALENQQGLRAGSPPQAPRESISSAPPGVVPREEKPSTATLSSAPIRSQPTSQIFSVSSPSILDAAHKPPPAAIKPATDNLEARIGGNWLLWVGIVALVLGTVYFLKLAFESGWIGPTMRVVIGIVFGTGFVFWGEALQKRNVPLYGRTVIGGGIAILYLSIYAAFNFYHLIPSAAAFSLMIVITATVSVFAGRYSSLALAFVGLIGGFLTPVWLSTGEDHQVILLSYIALLVAGVATLARRRPWMILNYSSFFLTLVVFLGWANQFYSVEKRGTTEFFLAVFAALFTYVGIEAYHRPAARARSFALGLIAATGILFYIFSFANLQKNHVELFSFIALFDTLVLLSTIRTRKSVPSWMAFVLNALTILLWLVSNYREEQLATTLAFLTVIFAVFLAGPLLFILLEKIRTDEFDLMIITLAGLGYFGALYLLLEPHHHAVLGLLAVSMSAVYFGVANLVWRRVKEEKKFVWMALGVAITFVTLAIPIQLRQNWITLSWAAEAVVLTGVASRTASRRMHHASWLVMILTLFRLFFLDSGVPLDSFQVILNKRFFTFVFVILCCYAIAALLKKAPSDFQSEFQESLRAFVLLASVLTVILMTLETSSFYSAKHQALIRAERLHDFNPGEHFRNIENAKQLTYSILWAIYSMILIAVGMIRRYRDLRLFAMVLFAITIAKVFFVDLSSLERVYRVISMVALGAILLFAAYLYQRFRRFIFED